MTTVNKIRIQSLAEQGNKRAVILEKNNFQFPKDAQYRINRKTTFVKYVCFLLS